MTREHPSCLASPLPKRDCSRSLGNTSLVSHSVLQGSWGLCFLVVFTTVALSEEQRHLGPQPSSHSGGSQHPARLEASLSSQGQQRYPDRLASLGGSGGLGPNQRPRGSVSSPR